MGNFINWSRLAVPDGLANFRGRLTNFDRCESGEGALAWHNIELFEHNAPQAGLSGDRPLSKHLCARQAMDAFVTHKSGAGQHVTGGGLARLQHKFFGCLGHGKEHFLNKLGPTFNKNFAKAVADLPEPFPLLRAAVGKFAEKRGVARVHIQDRQTTRIAGILVSRVPAFLVSLCLLSSRRMAHGAV